MVRGERGTLEYADGPRTLREFVETTWAYGDSPFLLDGERRFSYGEFFAAASALAVRLSERYGLRPGDRAVVAMRNLPEWQIAFWAAQLAGLIAVPLDARWSGAALCPVLEDCEPGVLLVDGERLERVGEWARRAGVRTVLFREEGRFPGGAGVQRYEDFPAPDPLAAPPDVEPRPEDDSVILYAAGTKGAVTTHLAQAGAALDARYRAAASALARGALPGTGPVPGHPGHAPVPPSRRVRRRLRGDGRRGHAHARGSGRSGGRGEHSVRPGPHPRNRVQGRHGPRRPAPRR
ncbi:AMP-binding protein [Streptomyces sp. NPDC059611]|uniref:AMP-binding protein n=1 Tax=Streptomyces sp. NPDC059611 TaxID=3346884 RepID=UPI00369F4EE2